MNDFEILLFYKYVYIKNPEELAKSQRQLQLGLGLTGRTLIAEEGINATIEGRAGSLAKYVHELRRDRRFSDIHIKRSQGTGTAFPKCVVKVKTEIVALNLGTCDIDPNSISGKRLSPEELHSWLASNKEFYIVDMRNAYEHLVGHFRNSILPAMDNFRDLPKFVSSIAHLKNKTVLTVCTGGVRCEKASGYLLANGFADVYQLDGGIVSYMEKYPNEDFLGKLYVFDNRIHMGFYTDDPAHIVVGKCSVCNVSCERFTNCHNHDCHRQLIACEGCEKNAGDKFICVQECKTKTRQTT